MMVKKTKTASEGLAISSFDVVAIAASAGGLNAINVVLANLPARFPSGRFWTISQIWKRWCSMLSTGVVKLSCTM
jgi:hypothetical protein